MSALQNKSAPSPNGFTLLEVMVALAIFSLAALALIRLQAFSIRSASDVISHDMAWQVARNRAAELLSDPNPPVLGNSNGTQNNGEQNYRWTQVVKKTEDARIIRIDIFVQGDDGRRAALQLARPLQL
jgi:general secretion pathway protein I